MLSNDKTKIIWEGEKDKEVSFNYWDYKTNSHSVQQCTPTVIRNNQYKEAFAKAMYPELVTGDESSRVKHLIKSEFGIYDTIEDADIPELAYRVGVPEHVLQSVVDYYEPRMMEDSSTTWEEIISEISSEVEALREKIKNLVKNGVYKANEWNIVNGCRDSELTNMTFPEVYERYVKEAKHLLPPDLDRMIVFLDETAIVGDEPTLVKYLVSYCHNQRNFLCKDYADELSKYYGDIKSMMWNIFKSKCLYDVSLERKNKLKNPREITLASPKDDELTELVKEADVASSPIQEAFDETTKIITKDTDKKLEEYIAQKKQPTESEDPDFGYEEGVYSREIFRIYNGDAEHPKLIKQVYGIPKKDMWDE